MVSGTISPFRGSSFHLSSRYWFAIGLTGVFSLTGWSRRIRAEFLVFRVTQDTTMPDLLHRTGLSPAHGVLSRTFVSLFLYNDVVLQPRPRCGRHWFGLFPVARHYWGIIHLFFFLQVLRCFSSCVCLLTDAIGQ